MFLQNYIDSIDSLKIMNYYRIDMEFHEANSTMNIKAFNPEISYSNFFLAHIPRGRCRLKNYKNLIYSNLYQNIDLLFSSNNTGWKYYYIIKPGGNPDDIEFAFTGQDSVYIGSNGELLVADSISDIKFPQAIVYQIDSNGSKINLNWITEYYIHDNSINFKSDSFDISKPLVIEIKSALSTQSTSSTNLEWSSFYNGSSYDWIHDIYLPEWGNTAQYHSSMYFCGSTNSTDLPFNTGGYSNTNFGNIDAFLVSVDGNTEKKFETYFGGSGQDQARCVTVQDEGGYTPVLIAGQTFSNDMIVVHPNNQYSDPTNEGEDTFIDGFIAEFSRGGDNLLWSTYYGLDLWSTQDLFDIAFDKGLSPNLYVVGLSQGNHPDLVTQSPGTNFTYGEGLILKFNENRELVWSTLFPVGGFSSIAFDSNDNFYLTGHTRTGNYFGSQNQFYGLYNDQNFPSTYSFNGGNFDAFVAKFNSNDQYTMFQYLGGENDDQGYGIIVDKNFNVYVTGKTNSEYFIKNEYNINSNNDYYNDALSNPQGGYLDGFITRINSSNEIEWSTYIGSELHDILMSVTVDENNNTYFTGIYGSGSQGSSYPSDIEFPSSPPSNYYVDNSIDDYSGDGLIVSFNEDCELIWSTYFGGNQLEYINSCMFKHNHLWIGGNTSGYTYFQNSFPLIDYSLSSGDLFYSGGPTISTDGFVARFFINSNYTQIEENKTNFQILAYPNPTDGHFYLKSNTLTQNNIDLIIYDIIGNEIYSLKMFDLRNSGNPIDLSNYNPGVYFVNIKNKNEILFSDFIIKL